MCGICGIFDPNSRLSPIALMNEVQKHRGPNDEGYVFINTSTNQSSPAGGPNTPQSLNLPPAQSIIYDNYDLVLGNRRLAILDLSPAGHMPMAKNNRTLWLTYNGEIYNYRELREQLKTSGHYFTSDSDTEVILAAYLEWDIDCLSHFNGMFAFVLWDSNKKRLFCARDRFGVKPFYYFWNDSTLIFASEIKSLLQHPFIPRIPNDQTVFDYLVLGLSDHTEQSFFKGIVALPPGHFLTVDVSSRQINQRRWWQAEINPRIESIPRKKEQDTYAQFADLLEDAIRLRLRSDVPIGSALSGGLDSSAVVCLANRLLINEQVVPPALAGDHQKTFTARFTQNLIDEYKYSNLVVKQTGAEEHVVFPKGELLWEEIRSFVWHMDEPVNSTSQYAQWNVMRLARQNNVTVLLDGQGGDEILAGYYSYLPAYLSQLKIQKGSFSAIRAGIEVTMVGGTTVFNTLLDDSLQHLPWRLQNIINKIRPTWSAPGTGGSGLKDWQLSKEFIQAFWDRRWQPSLSVDDDGLVGILYRDLTSTNLPKLLRYEDRNSMAFSLETRLPFLDYRLVEMVFSLPLNYRINRGWSKWILRQSMASVLPKEICWRRTKLGFPTPEIEWFHRGNPFIRNLLATSHQDLLAQYIRPSVLKQISELPDKALVNTPGLWRLINLIIWMDLFILNKTGVSK